MTKQNNPSYKNETIRLLHERASLRSYENRPIEPDILDTILKAGIHAPTGGNLQSYSIIQISKRETMERLGEMCWQKFIGTAAVNLIFCLDLRRNKQLAEIGIAPYTAYHSFRHFWVGFQDTIIAAQNICTAADALGLGSCYVATILEHIEEICRMCKLPDGVFPVVLLCLGYPKSKSNIARKFDTDVMVHQEIYKDTPHEALYESYTKRENNKQFPISNERVEKIVEVCKHTAGDEFAKICEESIKKTGYINPIQYRFGLHYQADKMAVGNPDFLAQLEKQGFDWFKEWVPLEKQTEMKGVLLENLTWQEAESLFTKETIIVLPLGAAAKEHGPHLRLNNDLIIAEYLKHEILERAHVVIAPTIPYHHYPAFVNYPGSTTLRLETARDLIVDICRSLGAHGPRKFYVLNTGVSTLRALEPAADILAKENILLHYTDLLKMLGPVEESVSEQEGGTHADEIETSMMLIIDPSSVDMSKAAKDYHPSAKGRLTPNPDDGGVYSPTGIYGDATLADRKKGEIVVKALVEGLLMDIENLRNLP